MDIGYIDVMHVLNVTQAALKENQNKCETLEESLQMTLQGFSTERPELKSQLEEMLLNMEKAVEKLQVRLLLS